MSTLYIACNNTTERGYFLGDVIVCAKVAHLFVESIKPERVFLSLMPGERWNFLWDKFIATTRALVLWDHWGAGDRLAQYEAFGHRIESRMVHDLPFDHYRELYPRLDGGDRQGILAGGESGLGRANIFEYIFFGQEDSPNLPLGSTSFEAGMFNFTRHEPEADVLVAPIEKCQCNGHFTFEFWDAVIAGLLERGITVTVNDDGRFGNGRTPPQGQHATYVAPPEVLNQAASHRLVLTGNSGIGWAAAAVGTPMIAGEKDLNFCEYSFEKCGCANLVHLQREPDVEQMLSATLAQLADPEGGTV